MHLMIVDGRTIAGFIYKEIQNGISHLNTRPHLTVFTCAPNFETQRYLSLKRRKAHEVGIGMTIIEFPENVTTQEVILSVSHAPMQTDGIVVQLPFPPHIDIDAVLKAVPQACDVDAIHYDGSDDRVLPPVVGAIQEIADRHDILFAAQHVVIVGKGKLVGAPASIWCQKQGAKVTVIDKETPDVPSLMQSAHIIISGAGQPGLITPDMLRENVVLFDAGTSEEGGVLKGDADPACAEKAYLFTPVPGGIGPITIAILLRNLLTLASRQ